MSIQIIWIRIRCRRSCSATPPAVLRRPPGARLVSIWRVCRRIAVCYSSLTGASIWEIWCLHTVLADHGDHSPTALTFLLEFGGVRVMASGDTSWRPKLFKPLNDLKPDVVLPVINGVFGNMNHIDAAMMVADAKPRIAIPCHFWTLAEQGAGDPAGFLHACAKLCPQVRAQLVRPGEGLTVTTA